MESAVLETRKLGRTERHVTTFGLGGQGALMLTPAGVDPVAIIEKALRLGVTYFDTANAYGASQRHYGEAFRRQGLVIGSDNYVRSRREAVYLASKTHIRTSRQPAGQHWRSDYSDGFADGTNVSTSADDVRRSISQIFGDGRGAYPAGAYLDCIQIHNITDHEDVDMLYKGFEDPSDGDPWLGALISLIDLRDGTNRSGQNPKRERLVRHIGITGHWSAAALMYAIQRDHRRVLDTLLVAVNPIDAGFLSHQTNSIPVAARAGMGVIAMKVFADASYYGQPPTFQRTPETVFQHVGHRPIDSAELIRYALSAEGVTLCLTGIGRIDSDASKCQLSSNIAAAQVHAMPQTERRALEDQMEAAGLGGINAYFERSSTGLGPPRNVGAEFDPSGFSPVTPSVRPAVRVTWRSAYARRAPVARYDVLRNGVPVGTVVHRPQAIDRMFVFNDDLGVVDLAPSRVEKHAVSSLDVMADPDAGSSAAANPRWTRHRALGPAATNPGHALRYIVRAVDAEGTAVDSDPVLLQPFSSSPVMRWETAQQIDEFKSFDPPDTSGMTVGAGRSSGTAQFDTGESASLAIAFTLKLKEGSGTHEVFIRHEFADGSSFSMTGVGITISGAEGATFAGTGLILRGTGRFVSLRGSLEYYGARVGPPTPGSKTRLTYRLVW